MLITFTTDAYESISYFENVAKQLITLMGHSGAVPGAIMAKDIPEALDKLQKAIHLEKENTPSLEKENNDDYDNAEPNVSLTHRALPLLNLLEAAKKKDCNVVWQ